jgi:protein-disulfide isomerase
MKSLAIAAFLPLSILATASHAAFSADQQKEIQDIVNNYLQSNPQVIISSLQAFQQKQMQEAENTIKNTQKDAPQFVQALFHDPKDPVVGNPTGPVTIVEFFDYQCSHCIDMAPVLAQAVKAMPNVRIVFKEFPIRGQMSDFAARAALAANMQGKYFQFHEELMKSKQPLSEAGILAAAKTVGLNLDQLQKDMDSKAVKDQITANQKLAQDLKLLGTPAFFIGKTNATNASAINYIPGEIKMPQLQDLVKKNS